jgi:hypothetical protein
MGRVRDRYLIAAVWKEVVDWAPANRLTRFNARNSMLGCHTVVIRHLRALPSPLVRQLGLRSSIRQVRGSNDASVNYVAHAHRGREIVVLERMIAVSFSGGPGMSWQGRFSLLHNHWMRSGAAILSKGARLCDIKMSLVMDGWNCSDLLACR